MRRNQRLAALINIATRKQALLLRVARRAVALNVAGQQRLCPIEGLLVDDRLVKARPDLVTMDDVADNKLTISVDWASLCDLLGIPVQATDDDVLLLETAVLLTRSERAIRMIQNDGRLIRSTVDLTLVRLIVKARGWWQRLQHERGLTASALAASENVTQSYVTRILRLAFLSPDVVKSIMAGRQPAWLDSGSLCNRDSISLGWD